jgi:hypothetical protein
MRREHGDVRGLPRQRVEQSQKRFARLDQLLHSRGNDDDPALEHESRKCSGDSAWPQGHEHIARVKLERRQGVRRGQEEVDSGALGRLRARQEQLNPKGSASNGQRDLEYEHAKVLLQRAETRRKGLGRCCSGGGTGVIHHVDVL